jgi:hypothetical protein
MADLEGLLFGGVPKPFHSTVVEAREQASDMSRFVENIAKCRRRGVATGAVQNPRIGDDLPHEQI